MTQRRYFYVSAPEKFVEWAKGRDVRMTRMTSHITRSEEREDGSRWLHLELALRIDYVFDAKIEDGAASWSYSETCEVDDDGWIIYKDNSPFTLLDAAGQKPVLVRRNSL